MGRETGHVEKTQGCSQEPTAKEDEGPSILEMEQEATEKQGKQKNQRWKMKAFMTVLSNKNIMQALNMSHVSLHFLVTIL